MPFYDEDPRDYTLPGGDWNSETMFEKSSAFHSRTPIPQTALCLKVPGTSGEELVVHRENEKDYVFLFEALDDAMDYANEAEKALEFSPEIGRVSLRELHFENARFKPALGDQVDLILRPY